MVDASRCTQLLFLDVFCGVPLAATLCPLLVALVAGQRASPSSTTRTAVLELVAIAIS
jgi:hypothetical protein